MRRTTSEFTAIAAATNSSYTLTIDGPAIPPDVYEPNDTFETAAELGTLGNFSFSGLSIHESGNGDYYHFTAASDGQATISTAFVHDLGDLDLAIYDDSQSLIGLSSGVVNSESVTINVTQGASYYVSVSGYSGAINPSYSLTIIGPAIPPDFYEPNDTFAAATNLGTLGNVALAGLSIHAPGNDDYFRFTAAANGQAQISTTFSHALGDLDLAVYDTTQTQLGVSQGVVDGENLTIQVTAGQTYFVRVYGFSGATNSNYSLTIVAPAIPPDVFEPNDTFATARNLGTLGNYSALGLSINTPTDFDYFRFTAVANGQASVSVQFLDSQGDLDMNAYDGSQSLIVSSNGVLDGEQFTFSVTQGSTYYISVFGYNGAINPAYNLLIGFTHSGDYSNNLRVDAADYVLWRNNQGQSVSQFTNGDGDGSGVVGAGDYSVWRSHFGNVVPLADASFQRRRPLRVAAQPRSPQCKERWRMKAPRSFSRSNRQFCKPM